MDEFCKVYDSNQPPHPNSDRSMIDYEEALNRTGIGKFNYFILLVCSLGLLSNGIQNGISAYLLPSLQCEFGISSSEMAMANVSFMIGGIASAYIWGILSNVIGIKTIIIFTLYADFLTMLIGSFSQNYPSFLVTRTLCGFFTGGPGYLLFTYLADFVPSKIRPTYICCAGFCFIISWILLPGVGLLIIPLEIYTASDSFKFTSWRLYSLIFTIPTLITVVLMSKLPDSPKQLLAKGNEGKCLGILKMIFAINTGKPEYYYRIDFTQKCALKPPKDESRNMENSAKNNHNSIYINYIKSFTNDTLILFGKKYIFRTFNIIFVLFTNMFGCYGLGLWIPELLLNIQNDMNSNTGDTFNVCSLKYTNESLANNVNNSIITKSCDDMINSQIYRDTIVIGIACLCYNFITACLTKHVNPRYLTSFSMILGAVSSFLFITLESPSLCLIAIGIFQSAMTTGNVIAVSVILEAFPSKLSSMAVCLATLGGRIGAICSNICFGMLIEVSCYYPILFASGLSFGGAVLILFVKKDEREVIKMDTTNAKDSDSNRNLDVVTTHI